MLVSILLAGWQSGYAAACKAVNSGSIPDSDSTKLTTISNRKKYNKLLARRNFKK